MRSFLLLFFIPLALFSSQIKNFRWSEGDTYLTFLEKQNLDTKSLYYNLDADDQKLTEEIRSGVNYQMLISAKKEIQQILIPINDDLQIHIAKDKKDLTFEVIPIIKETKKETLTIVLQDAPYNEILRVTKSKKLAKIFVSAFKKSLNFKNVHKGDTLVMVYERMYRLGHPFSMPILDASMIQIGEKKNYIYRFKEDQYFDEKSTELDVFLLATPIRNARISSVFTMMRWHPILHKFRAHLGVDYRARPGTPILAAGNGTVSFCSVSKGYGNLTKISHAGGYVTLYAHQKGYARGIHKGSVVKQGQVIGYVGTTGLSSGPHLHFGLYKDGRPINPQKVVRVAASALGSKEQRTFDRLKANMNTIINRSLKTPTVVKTFINYETLCHATSDGKERINNSKNSITSESEEEE